MRIATWNLKQAVAPKKDPASLWAWADTRIQPDVIVFTEAKVPRTFEGLGWNALWDPTGLYPEKRNRWGTVIASKTCDLLPINTVHRRFRSFPLEFRWPGAIQVADIVVQRERWATVVGVYGVLQHLDGRKAGNAMDSLAHFLRQLEPLLDSKRGDRILITGDFNVWPFMAADVVRGYNLTDLVEYTGNERQVLVDCANCDYLTKNGRPPRDRCGHIWTHRNEGGKNPAKQQIDFIFATNALVDELDMVSGGPANYPDVWDVSDHSPLVADFAPSS